MKNKRRYIIFAGAIALFSILTLSLLYIFPMDILSIQQKPEPTPQKVYDYYIILDEKDGTSLMYVPLVVNIGDEVLTEENKLYKVVRIEENRAYARFVENVDIEKYKNK